MKTNAALNDSGVISKKPAAMAASVQSMPTIAWPSDVNDSQLSRTGRQVWGGLCGHRNKATGLAWPKVKTLAKELRINERSVQRGLEELLRTGWVGTPFGDTGGLYKGIEYHLHPHGSHCLFCFAANRTINRRGQNNRTDLSGQTNSPPALSGRGDISVTPVNTPRGDILNSSGVTKNTPRGDIFDCAYKEGTFSKEPSLKREPSSTSATAPKTAPTTVGDDALSLQLKDPKVKHYFAYLHTKLEADQKIPIDVQREIVALGEPIQKFVYGFERAGSGRTKVGGVRNFARQWKVLTAPLDWPACLECMGSGTMFIEDSPFDKRGPCSCVIGERQAKANSSWNAWIKAKAEGVTTDTFCLNCHGTGRPIKRDNYTEWTAMNDGDPYCNCAVGIAKYESWKAQLEREKEERTRKEALGLCTWCDSGEMSNGHPCSMCKGTGRSQPPPAKPITTATRTWRGLPEMSEQQVKDEYRDRFIRQAEARGLLAKGLAPAVALRTLHEFGQDHPAAECELCFEQVQARNNAKVKIR